MLFEYMKLHHLGFSQKELFRIYEKYGTGIKYVHGIEKEIQNELNIPQSRLNEINKNSVKIELVEKYIEENGVRIIDYTSPLYPELLKNISNKPFLFYLKGELNNNYNIAIIGSRKYSSYGENICKNIAGEISKAGFTIVSGGAYGIDSIAHEAALNNYNKTVSIIGSGIDIIYPYSNKKLYERIIANGGGIISIFRLNTKPDKFNFPIRNEIIAGISKGVVVIEAGKNSGTLITARLALDFGRDVYVVPGDISRSNSIGSNMLIRDSIGKLVTSSEDILCEYQNIGNKLDINDITFGSEIEKKIYEVLLKDQEEIDRLTEILNNSVENISIALTMLELNGLIIKDNNGKYNIL